jgi:lysozyme
MSFFDRLDQHGMNLAGASATKTIEAYLEIANTKPGDGIVRGRITRSKVQNSEGLELLRFAVWKNGVEIDHVTVISGQPGKQNFRLAAVSQPGSMEPIPEGFWVLSGPFWCNGEGNYNDDWAPGLGPVVLDINPTNGTVTWRAELRVHQDSNETNSPGSAGCVTTQGPNGQRDFSRLNQILGWYKNLGLRQFETDWGLGSIVSRCLPK